MFLPFEGIPNFRDLGGVTTIEGKHVKKGLLYRCGELSKSTPKDLQQLQALHIRTIIDYRDESEIEAHPTPRIQGVHDVHAPASRSQFNLASIEDLASSDLLKQLNMDLFKEFYASLAFENPAYQTLVSILKAYEGPMIQHCTAGKDRTGIGSMITYLILGVPYTTIVQDFLETNQYMEKHPPYWQKPLELAVKDPEILQILVGVNQTLLDHVHDEILRKYGTIEMYLKEEYHIDEQTRKEIQDFYLE
ncbi:tyrosine-protein phosphatase [Kurthia gibsonii]|uniref:tyrosine-protein phosphatase n=1 Tax=Kurthia TaxID=1649 RepID=UPI002DB98686|nr:tyrosine-protein phosphatase [Kurthia gibsonii]MEB6112204.1 tyrosine-protein phosphatase [Kurthia gibsonii]